VRVESPSRAVPEPWSDEGGRRGDPSGVSDGESFEVSAPWHSPEGAEDDPAEIRRITSALTRIERPVYGDEPPF